MPELTQWAACRLRQSVNAALRSFFKDRGFEEVETPCLIPSPGMEPHIQPFSVAFLPETDLGDRRSLYLHTSPEYAMKRLLADGCGPIFQLCKVFRNGELSRTHNPEFTLLEFYRPNADYTAIMDDLEALLVLLEQTLAPGRDIFRRGPFERVTVHEAVRRETGIDLFAHTDGTALARAARAVGARVDDGLTFDDTFFHLFLQRVEPRLGLERPAFLIDYPASMAALARLKPGDPRVAERVELYAGGLELANGFSELIDATEQRRRLVEEQALRRTLGHPVPPLDEAFLEALGRTPPSAGIAVGIDRVLMLLAGASSIEEVLLFPASGMFGQHGSRGAED